MYNLTQFVQKFLISFLLVFSLYVSIVYLHLLKNFFKFFEKFLKFFLRAYLYIYIYHYIFTIHLIMTEARSKRRVLPLIFIVKSFKKPLLIRNKLKTGKYQFFYCFLLLKYKYNTVELYNRVTV